MPRYMLLIYGDEKAWAMFSPDEQMEEFKLYNEYSDWLREKGWFLAGEPLHPTAAASSVRVRDGKTLTTDGPFAETKEQLGGYYIVQVENLDEAIQAAERIPAARGGTIEVRPVFETEGMTP
jgi:hypothetical protein